MSPTTRTPPSRATSLGATPSARLLSWGLPQPRFRVEPAKAAAAYRAGEIVRSEQGTGAERHLVLALDRGGELSLTFSPPGGLPLPLRVGQKVRVRYYPPGDGPEGGASFLAIRDREDHLLAAIFTAPHHDRKGPVHLIPSYELPGGLKIGLERAIVYSEVRQLDSLCLARLEHRRFRVVDRRGPRILQPGTSAPVELEDGRYIFIAIDAARLADDSCPGEDPSHFSFALLAPRRVRRTNPVAPLP